MHPLADIALWDFEKGKKVKTFPTSWHLVFHARVWTPYFEKEIKQKSRHSQCKLLVPLNHLALSDPVKSKSRMRKIIRFFFLFLADETPSNADVNKLPPFRASKQYI